MPALRFAPRAIVLVLGCASVGLAQGAPQQPPPGYQQPPPGYQQPPPGYQQPPPGYQQPPPGYQQPPPGYGPPPPAYGPPPPGYAPPPVDPTARRHDGFYLRLGIGGGSGKVTSHISGPGGSLDAKYTGSGSSFELMLGGTVGSGVVIGGGFVGQNLTDPKVTVSGSSSLSTTASGSLGVVVLGPLVDWFFDPHGGAHLGAMIGSGAIGLSDGNDKSSTGLGAALWGGYDFWVGNQWSIGPELRVTTVNGKREFFGLRAEDKATVIQLSFTGLYH
ncbi:MAG: hypothetical protein IT374_24345 [Polyangiaceae bacterium]|nr:hypothetical protein [Polyangiaceae bacterium]